MTETTTIRGALIMPYPSALGLADEPLTIEWPEGHSYAVVATAFHGGAVLGTTATEDEAWAIYDQWPKTNCRCGCRGIVTRDGLTSGRHSYAVVGGIPRWGSARHDGHRRRGMGDLRSVAQDELQVRLPGYRHPRRASPQAWWESAKGNRRLTKLI